MGSYSNGLRKTTHARKKVHMYVFGENAIAAKIITNKLFTTRINVLAPINFVKNIQESLYKANNLACFLAKRDTLVAAT